MEGGGADQKGIGAKFGLCLLSAKKRFRAWRLFSVNHQAVDSRGQGKPSDGNRANFHAASGQTLQAVDQKVAQDWIQQAAAQPDDGDCHSEQGPGAKHPEEVLEPKNSFAARFLRHLGFSSSIISTRTRERLSLSQRSACSLIARCTSASWMKSRAFSRVGGVCLRDSERGTTRFL